MAGAAVHINYVSDDGNTYRVLVPSWQQALTSDTTPATATSGLPKGYRRRHRFIQNSVSGREIKVTCGDVTDSFWTAGFGGTVSGTIPNTPSGSHWTFQGRVGERDLIRG